MSRTPKAAAVIIPVLVLILAAGIMHMFSLRFETGDVFPPYSSLRSDPLGARGLHDSLQNLESVEVSRNYYPAKRLKNLPPAVILYSGVPSKWTVLADNDIAHDLKRLAASGNRVVITFSMYGKWAPLPSDEQDETDTEEEKDESASSESQKEDVQTDFQEKLANPVEEEAPSGTGQESAEDRDSTDSEDQEKDIDPNVRKVRDFLKLHDISSGKENWGLTLDQNQAIPSYEGTAILAPENQNAGLAPFVDWYSTWYFKDLSPDWNVVYTREDKPVVVEKSMGRGSLVFASGSYFLSNEALAAAPSPELLVWMVGPHSRIVFDEWHLGIAHENGISSLARKYGLAGAGLALLFWALLYLWHNGSPLVPRKSGATNAENDGEHLSTRGYAEAMASLLRRNISPAKVLEHCLELWEGSMKNSKEISPEVRAMVRNAIQEQTKPGQKESVEAYNRAVEILSRER